VIHSLWLFAATLSLLLWTGIAAPAAAPLSLWYDSPAKVWTEALPVGNGRLGAMVFGGAAHERIQFNEDTVWTGAPHDYAHEGAAEVLGELRELLYAGRQSEAEELAMRRFMSVPLRQKSYQAFGDLMIDQQGLENARITGLRRSLDLDSAIAGVEFEAGGVTYRREVFCSFPGQVIVVRLTASGTDRLSFRSVLRSAHEDATLEKRGNELSLSGNVAGGAIRYEARLAVTTDGIAEVSGESITVKSANSATLLLAGATNFVNYRDVSADPFRRNDTPTTGGRS